MSRLRGSRRPAHPALHLALLAGLSVWQLAVSWRRWADPIVDFGRELYIPWRLSEGAVLYRDVEDFYGRCRTTSTRSCFASSGRG